MQELIEWCNEFDNSIVKPTHVNMKEKIWQLLEKEKKQIIDACIYPHDEYSYGEIYYNETYKKERFKI